MKWLAEKKEEVQKENDAEKPSRNAQTHLKYKSEDEKSILSFLMLALSEL
jgi:hypothetical protein